MKIKAGQNWVSLPELVDPNTCDLIVHSDGDPQRNPGHWIVVCQVPVDEILKMAPEKRDVQGVPTSFAIVNTPKLPEMLLWPTPAKETHAQFRYHPAMKVI